MTEPLDRRLVAVVFTDMVGYTALLQADERTALEKRDRYWAALERHHDASEGTIVQRLGDGSMSMFPSSLAAVRAAVAVQRELAAQDVPVRIGIHTGEVIVEPERLTGEAVNVASRIESFATPGGVMLSDSAYEQIRNQADLEVVSLGRFKLKNVGRPFDIYAVRSDGLVVPDATALEGKGERIERFGARLPEAAAPLIGRADDLTALANLAQRHRIVTITGPGGVGKTTVLAELGRTLAPELLGAVAFVSLAEVDDPTAVLPSLAEALDVKEADARAPADGLVALIGDAESLLLLDNLEQVVDAGPDLAALVKRCPALRIVATSRTPLRVAGEQEYPLSPLPLPPPSENGSVEDLLAYPSVALFVERARSAKTAFALTPANAAAVAAICARLDGLPLALELAAARLRLLSPEALLERLDHALDVLASAQRDLPERQRTLRATIDWSHSLLDEPERRVLRRLSTFVGGCSVEDAEAVCAEPGGSCLDQLESLVDKALVQVDGSGDRLRLLQTVGEFAREQLDAAHEAPEVALRHARRYAQTAQEIRDGIEGTDQVRSVERGIAEEANLQAALDTLLSAARAGDANAAELGMQMSGDLWMYWHVRGKNVTAREVATSFLDAGSPAPATVGEAGALITVGLESWVLGTLRAVARGVVAGSPDRRGDRRGARGVHRIDDAESLAALSRPGAGARAGRAEHRAKSCGAPHVGGGVRLELRRHLARVPRRRGRGPSQVRGGARAATADRRPRRSRNVPRRPRAARIRKRRHSRGARSLSQRARRVRGRRRPGGGGADPRRDGLGVPRRQRRCARTSHVLRRGSGAPGRCKRARSRPLADRAGSRRGRRREA